MPHTHKHTDALKEIDFWLNWLKKQGTKQVTLMGHSRGGNQTAWYAAEHDSDAIKDVVLIAPATGKQQSANEYEHKYGKPLSPILKKAQVTAASFVDYYDPKPQFDTPTVLQNIKKPTLVIMGSADTVVPDLPEKITPLVDSGKVKSLMLEDADHLFLDFANEDMATAVVEFIQAN
ncbi:alpha/beta hydrolase [Thiomicrorhabdus sp. zzn3]|uniref:alpha/beta hydrolase n=1 Tax=Thiomicrorhabdus sp. zzn3 TaxID=3039775 RepID=UPI002436C72C|nr:alpha/beta hydrolase [Thiomicrorhabdus sp. zzn3]MDG6777679.1 alpha/beta hydrolase [Thiomicrorhabdus sp. zzn3]